jgi:hypothetical protein
MQTLSKIIVANRFFGFFVLRNLQNYQKKLLFFLIIYIDG